MAEKSKPKSDSYLAIDTSAKTPALCLGMNDKLIISEEKDAENNLLAKQIEKLFSKSDLTLADLSGIIVSLGPGSFTGLRVGLAFAKGLALSQDIPLVGIDRFSQVINGLKSARQSVPSSLALPMKADSWYLYSVGDCESYQVEISDIKTGTTEELLAQSENSQEKEPKIGFIDFDPPESFLAKAAGNFSGVRVNSKVEDLLILGRERLQNGSVPAWEELEPIYAQKSNAELNFAKRNRAENDRPS